MLGLWLLGSLSGQCFWNAEGRNDEPALAGLGQGKTVTQCTRGPGDLASTDGLRTTADALRASAKYQDAEIDLLYYGYRFYSASTGRWLSRDPAGEDAGALNLYNFVCNSPTADIDWLGLFTLQNIRENAAALDRRSRTIPCCCYDRSTIALAGVTITGSASAGQTVTGTATVEKQGCVLTYSLFWWTCYDAAEEVSQWLNINTWKNYGWSAGHESYSKTANADRWYHWFQFFDPYHIDMQAAVIYSYCGQDDFFHASFATSNELEWTWNKRTKSWDGPVSRGQSRW